MACPTLHLYFLILALASLGTAHATTRALPTPAKGAAVIASQPADSYCEIAAEFVEPAHTTATIIHNGKTYSESRVSWAFDISSRSSVGGAACPQGSRFDLAIRGAEFVVIEGAGQYVYPNHVRQPRARQRVTLQARLTHVRDPRDGSQRDEWLVTDWEQGFATSE